MERKKKIISYNKVVLWAPPPVHCAKCVHRHTLYVHTIKKWKTISFNNIVFWDRVLILNPSWIWIQPLSLPNAEVTDLSQRIPSPLIILIGKWGALFIHLKMYLFHFHFAWYKTLHPQLYSFNTLKMSLCRYNDKRQESILILNVVPRDFTFSSLPLSWGRVIMTGTIFFTLLGLKIQWCCLLMVSVHLENFLLVL